MICFESVFGFLFWENFYLFLGNKGRKTLKTGSIPTLFLPQKSIETPKAKPRRDLSRSTSATFSFPAPPELYRYTTFHDLQKDFAKIKDPWKILVKEDNRVIFGWIDRDGNVVLRVSVDEALEFSISYLSIDLPVTHAIYKEHKRSIAKTRIQWLLNSILKWETCKGVTDPSIRKSALQSQITDNIASDFKVVATNTDGQSLTRVHGSSCAALIAEGNICTECTKSEAKLKRKIALSSEGSQKPLAPNAPLKRVAKEKLAHAIKILRLKQKKLENTIKELNFELKRNGILISENLHDDFTNLINGAQEKLPEESFERLFWEQQQKAFKCEAKGMRWHPMMIRFALHVHLRSPSAYRALKESGVIKLPCERTLRDYSNIIHPKAGFNKETFDDLKHQASKLEGTGKYVVLMFDEVSIKDDLVFDIHTGDLVGFVDIGGDLNDVFGAGNSRDVTTAIASHALVFMVGGLSSRLKFSLGYFGTQSATSYMLFPLMWKAVGLCETYAGLKVVCVVSDKASPNQKMYKMHKLRDGVVYSTPNVFATDEDRDLYFFSDPPHLLKTTRNNFAASGFQSSRLMWNQKDIIWKHLVDLYESDRTSLIRKMPKLTNEHIHLNPYSKMRVNLAAQVMSETVGKIMASYGAPASSETAKFILMIDKFFDCCNTRSLEEGAQKRKPFLAPFVSENDERFVFLSDCFLKYLNDWKEAIDRRPGVYSKEDKAKMFLSTQTFEGIQTTVFSLIECVKFLLRHGFKYVLTNKISQDPLEDHFGRHRGLARRSTNPTLHALGFQENKLRLQRSIATSITPKGNTKGSKRPTEGITISHSPLKKRKKH